jgi:RNA polymerase sigma-70 factor (ECF subfamily)
MDVMIQDAMFDKLPFHATAIVAAEEEWDLERRVVSLQARRGQDLYGFAIRLGLPHDDAADVAQEAIARLWRELCSGKELLDLDAWAFRTTYRLAMDHHRLRSRVAAIGRLMSRSSRNADDPADATDYAALWRAVDALPERQRAVLYLRYRADLPFDRVGLVLGITASAARTHDTNARATLRRRLAQEEL